MNALALFTKLGKIVLHSKDELTKEQKHVAMERLREGGARLMKQIEIECEKDKQMSNLKGKLKEIKAIIN